MQTDDNTDKLLLVIIALFLPPVAVYMAKGAHGQFWLNLVLCLLFIFWFIAMIHAIVVVLSEDNPVNLNSNATYVPPEQQPQKQDEAQVANDSVPPYHDSYQKQEQQPQVYQAPTTQAAP
ncbi:hypothetical protein CAAN3_21S01552 [[Candida] anglica]